MLHLQLVTHDTQSCFPGGDESQASPLDPIRPGHLLFPERFLALGAMGKAGAWEPAGSVLIKQVSSNVMTPHDAS